MKLSWVVKRERHIKSLRWLIAFTVRSGCEGAKYVTLKIVRKISTLSFFFFVVQQCQGQINIFLPDLIASSTIHRKGKSITGNSIKFDFSSLTSLSLVVDQICLLIFDLFPQYFSSPYLSFFDWHSNLNIIAQTQEILLRAHENINFNMLWHLDTGW